MYEGSLKTVYVETKHEWEHKKLRCYRKMEQKKLKTTLHLLYWQSLGYKHAMCIWLIQQNVWCSIYAEKSLLGKSMALHFVS